MGIVQQPSAANDYTMIVESNDNPLSAAAWYQIKLTPVPELPTDGLIAYYPFNRNANDESENGNHGTVYGATLTTDRFGNPDSAYSFDGVDDYIEVAPSSNLDIRTKSQ